MKEQILICAFCEEFSSFQIVAFIFNDLFLFMTVLQSIYLNLFDPFFIFFFSSFTNVSALFTLSGANTLFSFFFCFQRVWCVCRKQLLSNFIKRVLQITLLNT